jgi:predicted lipid-binding transport protein (Tim44 family)
VLAAAAGRVPRGQVAAQKAQYGIAAVPHRTVIERDPIDAGLLPVERRGPGRLGLLGLLAIVGGAAALIFAAVLVGASLSSGALTGTAAPSTAVISSQAGPPVPSADPTPTDPAAVLAALQSSVDAGVAAGEIDADTGKNLRDSLQQLSKRLEQGKQAKVADGANELLKKIDGWAQDDQIPPQRAAELRALLQPLTVPQDRQA